MLFNSYPFLFYFLPAALILFHGARMYGSVSLVQVVMIVLSCYFYTSFEVWAIGVLAGSALVNYALGSLAAGRSDEGRSKRVLWSAVGMNLALLGGYKYLPFAASLAGWQIGGFAVPLGISFFTFHQIAYHIDIYRGRIVPGKVREYLLFITFFPHLIAGPIIRYAQFAPQLPAIKSIRIEWGAGVFLLSGGLFEKVVLGDTFGGISDRIFELAQQGGMSGWEAWKGALAYTLQIFFDFSGYALMAIGLGLMFGIRLPVNFDAPYRATSIVDFWRRWHITLSNFLRDYLYIPLGGNRHGPWRHVLALIATMTLAGLWHGAGWTFILWGAAHGVLLVIVHLYRKHLQRFVPIPTFAAWGMTFMSVTLLWVLFRSESFADATAYYAAMMHWSGPTFPVWGWNLLLQSDVREWGWIVLGAVAAVAVPSMHRLIGYHEGSEEAIVLSFVHGIGAGIMLWLSLKAMAGEPARSFVYFVF